MGIGILSAAYLVASVLFILSLGGLSNQERPSERFGMVFLEWAWRLLQLFLGQVFQRFHIFY